VHDHEPKKPSAATTTPPVSPTSSSPATDAAAAAEAAARTVVSLKQLQTFIDPCLAGLIINDRVTVPGEVLEIVSDDTPQVDISVVTPFFLKNVCTAISQKLLEVCFYNKHNAVSFDYLHVDLQQKTPVPFGTFPVGCKLPLAGDVTCSRQRGSMVCSALKVRVQSPDDGSMHFYPIGFYINGDSYKSVLSDVFVPAWLAKVLASRLALNEFHTSRRQPRVVR
jgi:hypothetical protein